MHRFGKVFLSGTYYIFKVSGPCVQTFCTEKDSYLKCKYLLMMLFYSETKKRKYSLGPPPPKKRHRDTIGRNMAALICVCLYDQP